LTYLVISHRSEALVWNILSNGWDTKRPVLVCLSAHNITAVWFDALAQVMVWLHMGLSWLSMDASGGVPWVSRLHVLDSMHEVFSSIALTLTQVLRLTKDVRANSFLVLHCLLNDHRLRVLLLKSFSMESHCCAIKDSLFAISESVVRWIKLPVVIPLLLFAWSIVSMSLPVHRSSVWILGHKGTANWVKHLLGTLESLGWHTELNVWVRMLWPLVLTAETFAQRFPGVRCILVLLDIVELVGKTGEGLRLDDLVHWIRAKCGFSITVVVSEFAGIICHTPMLLNFAGLVNMRFPILLEVLRSRGSIAWLMHVLANREVCVLSVANTHNLVPCTSDFWDWVVVNSH
jgi:hypothetical protein